MFRQHLPRRIFFAAAIAIATLMYARTQQRPSAESSTTANGAAGDKLQVYVVPFSHLDRSGWGPARSVWRAETALLLSPSSLPSSIRISAF